MSSTEEEVEEAKAATKIQAVFRGRQVRKQGQGSGADETAVSTNDQGKLLIRLPEVLISRGNILYLSHYKYKCKCKYTNRS